VLLATADAVLGTWQPGHQLRVIVAGNTTATTGALYQAASKQRDIWHTVRITSDPDDPDRTPRVSAEWAREQIKAYGRDNPWVKINVFAEFPDAAIDKLLSLGDLEAAAARKVEEDRSQPLVLGVDVGTVTDAAVIYPRRGRLLYEPIVLRGASTVVIAGEVVRAAREYQATTVFVDAGGPGIGVVDQLRQLGQSCVPVYFGGGADDSNRYQNKRIEMHARLAQWIKEGGAIGSCSELVQDLLEPEVSWNLKGQQIMEPKDEVKKRLGRSPDWGDAAALTFAYPVAAAQMHDGRMVVQTPTGAQVQHIRDLGRAMREQGYDEFGFGGGG
jgi:phage terminase large subunit